MLKFEINGQKMTRVDTFAPATDSKGYLKASFSFSGDWANATKTAIFRDELTGESYEAPLNSSGVCTVPAEVLTRSAAVHYQTQGNHFHVSLRGDIGAVLVTTNEVKVELARSGYTEGHTPAAPTPDAYSQFVANVKADADRAAGSAEAAETSEQNVANLYANALKKTVSGEIVTVSDVSPVEHELGIVVHGKNLLKPSRGAAWQCTVEVAEGGKITLTNTATSGVAFARVGTLTLRKGKTYVYSRFDPTNITNVLTWLTGTTTEAWYPVNGVPFTPQNDVTVDVVVYMSDISAVGNTASIYIQIEEGEAATDYEPYIDPTDVTLTRRGKNMLNFDNVSGDVSGMYRGWLVNPAEQDVVMSIGEKDANIAITGIYVGLNETGIDAQQGYTWIVEDGEVKSNHITEKFKYVSVFPNTDYAVSQLKKRFNIQVEPGTVPTTYEPYQGETFTPAADGTVEGVKSLSPNMTLLTDTPGVTIEATYHRDLVKVIEALEAALN